jgi:hypothetical protein
VLSWDTSNNTAILNCDIAGYSTSSTNYIKILGIIEYFYNNKGDIENLINITPKNNTLVEFNEYIQDYKKTFDLNKMKNSNLNTNYVNYFNKGITPSLDEIEGKIIKFEKDIELLREMYDSKINNNKQQEFHTNISRTARKLR